MISIDVNNRQALLDIPERRLQDAVQAVLQGEGISAANISIAVVDDAAIHALNHRYLQHDYPTDVLSFLLSDAGDVVDGEVVVSAETAERQCGQFGWLAQDELVLYIVHGVLHLVGYDDQQPHEREVMRARERFYLNQMGSLPATDALQGDV